MTGAGPVPSKDLYPYGERPEEQAGTLMAWAWGVSKIIDLIEMDVAGPNELRNSIRKKL